MATYVFGDIQGCLQQLQALLKKVDYNPKHDHLGFVGDLVNRGPDSLQTLRFIKSLSNTSIVLGNHDLHLIALCYGSIARASDHSLHPITQAKDKIELCEWLRHQPLLHHNPTLNYWMVHAGIAPQWDIQQTRTYAQEIEQQITGTSIKHFLDNMYGNHPCEWHHSLTDCDRLRYITNALTRMRFCTQQGKLNFTYKRPAAETKRIKPWFKWYTLKEKILFGHWAALQGNSTNPNCIALDTGCVWGNTLSALHVEQNKRVSVPGLRHAPHIN